MPFRTLLTWVADLVWPWPDQCYICGAPLSGPANSARILCDRCADIAFGHRTRCGRCGRALPATQAATSGQAMPVCGGCRLRPPPYGRVYAAASYEGPCGALVRGLKYGRHTYVVPYLVLVLAGLSERHNISPDLLVPMPIHGQRLAQRGFNQAALLARGLARNRRWSWTEKLLVRVQNTRSLAGLSRTERAREVAGAFACQRTAQVHGRHVLLVDDVLTTGSSATACTRALLEAGAATVNVLVVARTEATARRTLAANTF